MNWWLAKIEAVQPRGAQHLPQKMDCAICYDAITKSTGKVELSCSHTFHINCLTTWFKSQSEMHNEQNCPCCRHELNEAEEVPMVDKAEIARFKNLFKAYEDQVTHWHITATDAVTKYRREVDKMEALLMAQHTLVESYEKEANTYRLLLEASRQVEIKNAKKMSVANWEKWSVKERKG